jgi:hypothetical protein
VALPAQRQSSIDDEAIGRLRRRAWPITATVVFVGLGIAYSYLWPPFVQHHPFQWFSPIDIWGTFNAAQAFSHGHFGAAYAMNPGFLTLPGILILLAPLAALPSSTHESLLELGKNHQVVQIGHVTGAHGLFLRTQVLASGGHVYVFHPVAWILLGPYMLLLSCSALFACDALAERLQVPRSRRVVLVVAQGVLLWNVSVFWGHPEDALAVALAIYAVVFALNDRWTGAGWLFGAAVVVQPLVILVLPILLFVKGRRGVIALALRAVAPAVVIALPSAISDFHATAHALVTQPALPSLNHQTPWTSLAPKLGGKNSNGAVGGGAIRSVTLVLAVVLGWWARRWRNKPEMLVWAIALAFGLRCFTESVMTAYYVWPALAVGLVVAARASAWRFRLAVGIAVFTTVTAQWGLGLWTWWLLDIGGVIALLLVSFPAESMPAGERGDGERPLVRTPTTAHRVGQTKSPNKKKKRKAARTDRKAARR